MNSLQRLSKNFIAQAGSDYAASRGEFLNGYRDWQIIWVTHLWILQNVFSFEDNGNLDGEMTYKKLAERLGGIDHVSNPGILWISP